MMNYPYHLISVFTKEPHFLGNISAVVELPQEISSKEMQQIANDLNQPASTFIWKENDTWRVRWFAPDAEIELCGHGAAAAICFLAEKSNHSFTLKSRQNSISGKVNNNIFSIELPIGKVEKAIPPIQKLEEALGVSIKEYLPTNDKDIVLLEKEQDLREMNPNFSWLKKLTPFGYAVTAKGDAVDFVSRTLVPKVQQLEDHATGSSHTVLLPYWKEKLHKNQLTAKQLSPRGGFFSCSVKEKVVVLSGGYKKLASGIVLVAI